MDALVVASRNERFDPVIVQFLQRYSESFLVSFERVIPDGRGVVFVNDFERPSSVGRAVDVDLHLTPAGAVSLLERGIDQVVLVVHGDSCSGEETTSTLHRSTLRASPVEPKVAAGDRLYPADCRPLLVERNRDSKADMHVGLVVADQRHGTIIG